MNRRKKYLLSFILALLFWLAAAYLVIFTTPANKTIFLFFLFLYLAFFLTFSFILVNRKRGFLISLGLLCFLLLKFFGVFNILNGLLLLALFIIMLFLYGR